MAPEKRICKECGSPFELEEAEVEWYEKKQFKLPSRCGPCRSRRRAQRKNPVPAEAVEEVPESEGSPVELAAQQQTEEVPIPAETAEEVTKSEESPAETGTQQVPEETSDAES